MHKRLEPGTLFIYDKTQHAKIWGKPPFFQPQNVEQLNGEKCVWILCQNASNHSCFRFVSSHRWVILYFFTACPRAQKKYAEFLFETRLYEKDNEKVSSM